MQVRPLVLKIVDVTTEYKCSDQHDHGGDAADHQDGESRVPWPCPRRADRRIRQPPDRDKTRNHPPFPDAAYELALG